MPNSPHWLQHSPACRIDWRPSRWPRIALGLLAACAQLALWSSALDAVACMAVSCAVLLHAGWQWRRESRQAAHALWWPGGGRAAEVDGVAVTGVRLLRRGPLWVLKIDGGGPATPSVLVWWPDTLDLAARRELALAVDAHAAAPARPPMAP